MHSANNAKQRIESCLHRHQGGRPEGQILQKTESSSIFGEKNLDVCNDWFIFAKIINKLKVYESCL